MVLKARLRNYEQAYTSYAETVANKQSSANERATRYADLQSAIHDLLSYLPIALPSVVNTWIFHRLVDIDPSPEQKRDRQEILILIRRLAARDEE